MTAPNPNKTINEQIILIVTNEYLPEAGGVATYCGEMARALIELGYKPIVCASTKGIKNTKFDRSLPYEINRMPELKWVPFRHLMRLVTILKTGITAHPQAILAADWRSGISAAIAARLMNIPYGVMTHGTEINIADRNWISQKTARFVYLKARQVFANSRYTSKLLGRKLNIHTAKVTPLGVDTRHFVPNQTVRANIRKAINLKGYRVLLTVGRLVPRKGHDIIIKAMPTILSKVPNTIYLIAGKGEERKNLKTLAQQTGVENNVLFLGYVEQGDLPNYYNACDVFVMLSRQHKETVEGYGLTFLEAAACKKPSIGGRHGAVPEVITDKITGLLVDPCKTEDFSNAVVSMMNNDSYLKELGENAYTNATQVLTSKKCALHTLKGMGVI